MATNPTAGLKPNDYDDPVGAYIGQRLITPAAIFMCISTIFIGLRMWTRKCVTQMLGTDDYLIGAAWLCASVLSITDIIQCSYGTGRHLWEVELTDYETFLKLQMVVGNFYTVTLGFSKCSILVFYLRLSQVRSFRIMVYATLAFITTYVTIAVGLITFSCIPVAASWDLELAGLAATTCINRPINYLVQSSLNIFTDILIMVLPIRTVWKLQMRLSQRLSVIAIFICGGFVCVVSIIRLDSIITLLESPDLTWDTTNVLLWSTIESHVSIICACSPHLRPLVLRVIPGLSHTTSRGAYPQYPTMHGKSQNLDKSRNRVSSAHFELHTRGFQSPGQGYTATVTSSARHANDNDSEEMILGPPSKNVSVTQTVHVK